MTCRSLHDENRDIFGRRVEEGLDGVDDGECFAPLSCGDQAPGDGRHFDDGCEFADGMTDSSKVGAPAFLADDVKATNCGVVVEVVQEGA